MTRFDAGFLFDEIAGKKKELFNILNVPVPAAESVIADEPADEDPDEMRELDEIAAPTCGGEMEDLQDCSGIAQIVAEKSAQFRVSAAARPKAQGQSPEGLRQRGRNVAAGDCNVGSAEARSPEGLDLSPTSKMPAAGINVSQAFARFPASPARNREKRNWCPKTDLNRRPIAYKAIALPTELLGRKGRILAEKPRLS